MKMKKPEMNVLHFMDRDVIAASVPAFDFELSGFYNRIADDLTVKIGGEEKYGADLLAALQQKYNFNGKTIRLTYKFMDGTTSSDFILSDFTKGSDYDNKNNNLYRRANGVYKYSSSSAYEISFSQITQ